MLYHDLHGGTIQIIKILLLNPSIRAIHHHLRSRKRIIMYWLCSGVSWSPIKSPQKSSSKRWGLTVVVMGDIERPTSSYQNADAETPEPYTAPNKGINQVFIHIIKATFAYFSEISHGIGNGYQKVS